MLLKLFSCRRAFLSEVVSFYLMRLCSPHCVSLVVVLDDQSHICRTFKLIRLFRIHPPHSSYSEVCLSVLAGQSIKYSGHVPPTICGTPCHANLDSPLIYTALPDLNLSVTIFSSLPSSFSLPSSPFFGTEVPRTKMASHPRLTLTNPVPLLSATSLCTLSVSPGE